MGGTPRGLGGVMAVNLDRSLQSPQPSNRYETWTKRCSDLESTILSSYLLRWSSGLGGRRLQRRPRRVWPLFRVGHMGIASYPQPHPANSILAPAGTL